MEVTHQSWPLQVERTAMSAEPDGIGQIPNPQSGQSVHWRQKCYSLYAP